MLLRQVSKKFKLPDVQETVPHLPFRIWNCWRCIVLHHDRTSFVYIPPPWATPHPTVRFCTTRLQWLYISLVYNFPLAVKLFTLVHFSLGNTPPPRLTEIPSGERFAARVNADPPKSALSDINPTLRRAVFTRPQDLSRTTAPIFATGLENSHSILKV